MTDRNRPSTTRRQDVANFLDRVKRTPVREKNDGGNRLLFAMDATASREPTWDQACHIQNQMFAATESLATLSIQLSYYRGFGEFKFGGWCDSSSSLIKEMNIVRCAGGLTQIKRVLEHALNEHKRHRVKAMVFVGDTIEEDADQLCHLAGQMGVLNVPLFLFQEGEDNRAKQTFKQLASLSGGAFAPFNVNSASELSDLLSAVAVYAAGGRNALRDFSKRGSDLVQQLTHQLKD